MAIEHDWRMRKLIQVNLEALGLEVRGAVNVQHGLHMLRQASPALILLDLDLPDMDAVPLLDALQTQLADRPVPIIILSAEPPGRWWRPDEQAISYLVKPFAAPALLQQVRRALGHVPASD